MNKLVITTGVLALLALGAGTLTSTAQDDGADDMPQPMEQHEWLASGVGEWVGVLTMYTPEGPQVMRGTETVEMFGPFHLLSHFKGTYMGLPFEGKSSTGYDPIRGHFTGSWMDTMTPSVSFSKGQWDKDTNTLTMRYESPNMMGAMDKMKSVLTITDADHKAMEFYVVSDEGEAHQMSIAYSRRKADGMR